MSRIARSKTARRAHANRLHARPRRNRNRERQLGRNVWIRKLAIELEHCLAREAKDGVTSKTHTTLDQLVARIETTKRCA